MVIQAKDLVKVFRKRQEIRVLNGVSLQIEKGEFVAIIGRSGAGKTTLLNILAGLDTPDKGSVHWFGENLFRMNADKRATFRNQHIGLIFQLYHLFSDLTALENVLLAGRIRPRGGFGDHTRRAKMLLEKVGLKDRITHFPQELSGGEMQRVAIARALMNDPAVLLCDEPTGNLDSQTGQEICDMLKGLCQTDKKSIIVVTHDDKIKQYANRVLRMQDGGFTK